MENNIKEQYELLSSDIRKALLIYKSRLGLAMNYLSYLNSSYLDYLKNSCCKNKMMQFVYTSYKSLLSDPKNSFIKYSVFSNVDFSSMENFIKSLNDVNQIIFSQPNERIFLSEPCHVYRAFSSQSNEEQEISLGNFVSTTKNVDEAEDYFIDKPLYTHYLYDIYLEKDTPVLLCPYGVCLTDKDELYLSRQVGEDVVIFLKNEIDITLINEKTIKEDDGNYYIIRKVQVSKKERKLNL